MKIEIEEVKKILNEAMDDSLTEESEEGFSGYADRAWNRGVKHMHGSVMIRLCQFALDQMEGKEKC